MATCPIAKADSISLSLANDEAVFFHPALNKFYSHADENRDDCTQGLFIGYGRDITDASQLSFHITPDVYSPSGVNKKLPTAVTRDRAFSAYLHSGIDWNSVANDRLRYRLGADFGIIGPDAGGQKIQNKVHQFINAEKYQAWDDKIKNRYRFTVKGMFSFTPNVVLLGTNIGIYPEVSTVSDNLFQYIGYGATFAIGNDKTFNSDNGFSLLDRRGLIHTSQKDNFIYKFFCRCRKTWDRS